MFVSNLWKGVLALAYISTATTSIQPSTSLDYAAVDAAAKHPPAFSLVNRAASVTTIVTSTGKPASTTKKASSSISSRTTFISSSKIALSSTKKSTTTSKSASATSPKSSSASKSTSTPTAYTAVQTSTTKKSSSTSRSSYTTSSKVVLSASKSSSSTLNSSSSTSKASTGTLKSTSTSKSSSTHPTTSSKSSSSSRTLTSSSKYSTSISKSSSSSKTSATSASRSPSSSKTSAASSRSSTSSASKSSSSSQKSTSSSNSSTSASNPSSSKSSTSFKPTSSLSSTPVIYSSSSPTYATSSSTTTVVSGATGKSVLFHYMIGTITDAHCQQDILDAQALGVDSFALNIASTASWALTTVASLFHWAETYGFKLFFSFDMTGFDNPKEFMSILQSYVTSSAYYNYAGYPLVTTFNGGASGYTFGQDSVNDGWKVELQEVMASAGYPIYFTPAFQDVSASSDFFTTQYPTLNGTMNWNSWPQNTQGNIIVPTTDDVTYLSAAHDAGKTFIMGVSTLQYKHIDSGQNWYRRGEQNLEYRFGQVLNLQPDMIELQSWNDAGESHYMGNIWPEPIAGTDIVDYTSSYDHTGYNQILPAFIQAYKSGATTTAAMYPTNGEIAQGVFWHHTLLAGADCSSDGLGKPMGAGTIEDKVTAVVLVSSNTTDLSAIIESGSTFLGNQTLFPGYNSLSLYGLTTGIVTVQILNSIHQVVIEGTGSIAVTNSSNLCNYNFQVVGLT